MVRLEIKEKRVFEEKAFCECGGEFVTTKIVTHFPVSYELVCSRCSKFEISNYSYPRLVYEDKSI